MKRIVVLVTAAILCLSVFSGCEGVTNITYEDAKYASGFITISDGNTLALTDDGEIQAFSEAKLYIDDYNASVEGVERKDIKKIVNYDCTLAYLTEQGQLVFNGYIIHENCKDFEYYDVAGTGDVFAILTNTGNLKVYTYDEWRDGFELYDQMDRYDFTKELKNVTEVYMDVNAECIICVLGDGTVSIGKQRYGDLDGAANAIQKASAWDNIQSITCDLYSSDGTFIAGLKKDGTVITTGKYSEDVKDWKNIVKIGEANGYLIGLKSNGTMVSVGKYADRFETAEGRNPLKLKNIIGFDTDSWGRLIVLTSDGEVPGYAKGIGPAR